MPNKYLVKIAAGVGNLIGSAVKHVSAGPVGGAVTRAATNIGKSVLPKALPAANTVHPLSLVSANPTSHMVSPPSTSALPGIPQHTLTAGDKAHAFNNPGSPVRDTPKVSLANPSSTMPSTNSLI